MCIVIHRVTCTNEWFYRNAMNENVFSKLVGLHTLVLIIVDVKLYVKHRARFDYLNFEYPQIEKAHR